EHSKRHNVGLNSIAQSSSLVIRTSNKGRGAVIARFAASKRLHRPGGKRMGRCTSTAPLRGVMAVSSVCCTAAWENTSLTHPVLGIVKLPLYCATKMRINAASAHESTQ